MKNIYFTPGPSQIYPKFRKHLQNALSENIPSVSHRGSTFTNLFLETRENLSGLLAIPKTHKIYFLSSATECMERIIQSVVLKNSFHFVNGAFSELFYKTAINLRKKAYLEKVLWGRSFNFSKVIIPKNIELICFTHNETSTGVSLNLDNVIKLVPKRKEQLFALDIVSSVPYVSVDFSKFDIVFFSVQKGFGLPAGLGVLIVSDSAYQKATKVLDAGVIDKSYHDIVNLEKYALLNQTPETPNVLLIYLFNKIIVDMRKMGLKKVKKDTEIKSKIIYDFFENSDCQTPFVLNPEDRSNTVCVSDTKSDSNRITEPLKKRGLVIGSGYKDMKLKQIRIANFPAHSVGDVEKLIRQMKLVEKKLK